MLIYLECKSNGSINVAAIISIPEKSLFTATAAML